MSKLILPKTFVKDLNEPVIFLASPILSAPNWQDKAIMILFELESNLIIVSPKRGSSPEIEKYIVSGDTSYFPRQRAWERHYLDVASKKGCILFWLPGEEQHNCQKVFGAMTRVEIGQWMTHYNLDNKVRFCIGTDGKFPEVNTIEFDLKLDAPDKIIHKTLEETCLNALKIATQK